MNSILIHGLIFSFLLFWLPYCFIVFIAFFFEILKSNTFMFPFEVAEQNSVGLNGDQVTNEEYSF